MPIEQAPVAYWIYGMVLGLSAGLSPGPLMALVISHTLQHGAGEGVKVALAPLVTDAGVVAICLVFFSVLPHPEPVLGVVSLVGGGVVFWMGLGSLRQGPVEWVVDPAPPRSLLKGTLVNALSPHPYLFWFSVGVPTLIKASQTAMAGAVGFAVLFMGCLVGSKMVLALGVSKSRRLLTGRPYRMILKCLGAALVGFSVKLVWDGFALLGLG